MKPIEEIRRENLRALANSLGGVARLAERIEKSSSQISQWLNASLNSATKKPRVMSRGSARYIEGKLGLPLNWMDHDHGGMSVSDAAGEYTTSDNDQAIEQANTSQGPDIRHRVPLISWTTAGEWAETVDNFQPGDADDWIATTANVGDRAYALRIRGESMMPTIPDGAIVIVDPDTEARHRSIVIVRQNGDTEATCKRLIYEGDRPMIRPDNPVYAGQISPLSEDATISGVVRQVVIDLE